MVFFRLFNLAYELMKDKDSQTNSMFLIRLFCFYYSYSWEKNQKLSQQKQKLVSS